MHNITGNATIYRNRTKVNSGGIEARLCESVSTNQTALRVIFAKMIGIRNLTVLTKSYGIETKKSNHSVTLTVAQRNNTLCHQISRSLMYAVTAIIFLFQKNVDILIT